MYGRKLLVLATTIFLLSICLVSARMANATIYPDIQFNNSGYIEYNPTRQVLSLHAMDLKIVYPSGEEDSMWIDMGSLQGRIPIDLNILVNNTGNYIGDDPNHAGDYDDMTETITKEENIEFEFKSLDGIDYNAPSDWKVGDVLLRGDVESFTSQNVAAGRFPTFEFIINPYDGLFIDRNIFPDYPILIRVTPDEVLDAGESWATGFRVEKAKGDKMPTPEPASILLFSLGLLGLGVTIVSKKRG